MVGHIALHMSIGMSISHNLYKIQLKNALPSRLQTCFTYTHQCVDNPYCWTRSVGHGQGHFQLRCHGRGALVFHKHILFKCCLFSLKFKVTFTFLCSQVDGLQNKRCMCCYRKFSRTSESNIITETWIRNSRS